MGGGALTNWERESIMRRGVGGGKIEGTVEMEWRGVEKSDQV